MKIRILIYETNENPFPFSVKNCFTFYYIKCETLLYAFPFFLSFLFFVGFLSGWQTWDVTLGMKDGLTFSKLQNNKNNKKKQKRKKKPQKPREMYLSPNRMVYL